jgi:hypothetical protein
VTSPAWALIKRDLVATLRRPRVFLPVAAAVFGCILVVAFQWPDEDRFQFSAPSSAKPMFRLFSLIHFTIAVVLPPGLAALAFIEERRRDSFDQLRLSLIRASGLVWAKIVAALAIVVLVFVASVPVLGVQLFLTGIDPDEILGLVAVVLSTALMGAAIGQWAALRFRRPMTALSAAYLGTAFVLGGWIPVVMLLLFIGALLCGSAEMDFLLTHMPGGKTVQDALEALVKMSLEAFGSSLSAGPLRLHIGKQVAYRLAITALAVGGALWVLRRPLEPAPVRRQKAISDERALRMRRRRFPYYLIDPLRARPPIADGANPIAAREWRHGFCQRPQVWVRLFVVTTVVFLAITLAPAYLTASITKNEEPLRVSFFIVLTLVLLVVQMAAAGYFARDRDPQNSDLLRMTLLRPGQWVWGQLAGGAVAASPFLAGVVASFILSLLALALGFGRAAMFLGGYATVFTCLWFTLCLALCASQFTRSAAAGLTLGLLLNIAVYLWPLALILLVEVTTGGGTSSIRHFEQIVQRLSPVVAFVTFRWRTRWGMYAGAVDEMSVESDLYLILAAFVAAGFLLLLVARGRLGRALKRDS